MSSILAGEITLEPLSEETLEFVRLVRSNPKVYRWLRDPKPVTTEEQKAWFSRYLDQSEFCVYVGSRPGWLFGYSQLRQSAGTHNAEIGICIAPYSQGKGLGEILLRATIAKAWELGLSELWAFILTGNIRSVGLFEKCGFEPSNKSTIWVLERRQDEDSSYR